MPKAESGKKGGSKGGVARAVYTPAHAVIAQTLCRMGAIDRDVAEALQVSVQTVEKWRLRHPEFNEACAAGKACADDAVEQALYRRATGWEHRSDKIFQYMGAPVIVPYVERFAPDTAACIFWLKNRRRKDWNDKWEIKITEGASTGDLLIKARERRKLLENG